MVSVCLWLGPSRGEQAAQLLLLLAFLVLPFYTLHPHKEALCRLLYPVAWEHSGGARGLKDSVANPFHFTWNLLCDLPQVLLLLGGFSFVCLFVQIHKPMRSTQDGQTCCFCTRLRGPTLRSLWHPSQLGAWHILTVLQVESLPLTVVGKGELKLFTFPFTIPFWH